MRRLLLVLVLALVAAACGSDESAAPATTAPPDSTTAPATTAPADSTTLPPLQEPGFPVTITSDAGTATVERRPERIAALSSVFVEMLYAIGAGDQVFAGDLFTNYPPETDSLEKIDSFNLNAEAIIELDPDLVVLSFDPGDVAASLEAVGIPAVLMGTPSSLNGAYEQIQLLGDATGRSSEAAELIDQMRTDIKEIVNELDGKARGITFYHETDPFDFYTPNSSSFVGALYAALGMENIADAAPDEFNSGFPQLSPEFIVEANPQMIFIASAGESVETMAARPGWDQLSALRADGTVVLLNPDVASRWGPRVVDLLRAIAQGVERFYETL